MEIFFWVRGFFIREADFAPLQRSRWFSHNLDEGKRKTDDQRVRKKIFTHNGLQSVQWERIMNTIVWKLCRLYGLLRIFPAFYGQILT